MPFLQLFAGRQNSERHHAGVARCPCYMMLGWTLKEAAREKAQQRCLYVSSPLGIIFRGPTGPSGFHWQRKLALTFVSGHFPFFSLKLTFPADISSYVPFGELLDFSQGEVAPRPYHVCSITWTLEESGREKSCKFGEMQKTHLKLLFKYEMASF